MKTKKSQKRRDRAFRPEAEKLEGRVVLSWSSVPPSAVNLSGRGDDRITISSFHRNGDYTATNKITRNEVDYRTFVAQRSGTYTFEARASGSSRIDTVAALFDRNGKRLAYNNDANSNTDNSKFTAQLVAGRKYVLGITNYRNRAKGSYRVVITSANLWANAAATRSDFGSSGSARLNGTTLEVQLHGYTRPSLYYADHYIDVLILDRNGQPIHEKYWRRGFRTAGNMIPGWPGVENKTWSIDVSAFDLGRAYRLHVVVGYY